MPEKASVGNKGHAGSERKAPALGPESLDLAGQATDLGRVVNQARLNVDSLSPGHVLQLQRMVGNRAVEELVSPPGQRTAPPGPAVVRTAAPGSMIQRAKGTLVYDPTQVQALRNPGVEATFAKATQITPEDGSPPVDAQHNDRCILHADRKDGHGHVFVEKYHLEGDGDDKEVKIDVKGWADPAAVSTSFGYEKVTDDIFPHEPTTEDVAQGGIGDCYLLAAILSIVQQSPGTIKSMMKDEGERVVVKLWQVDLDLATGHKDFTPRYVSVEKSRGVKGFFNWAAFAKGALWVRILEKAFAAFGRGASLQTKHAPVSPSYVQIGAGGHADYALEILTGKRAESTSAKASGRDTGLLDPRLLAPGKRADLVALFAARGIVLTTAEAQAWQDFVIDHALEFQAIQAGGKTLHYEEFARIVDTWANRAVATLVNNYARTEYPGALGTGQYTVEQEALFEKIRSRFAAGGYIALGSPTFPGGGGRSADEGEKAGIVGPHAYAVTGVRPERAGEVTPRKEVRLRNPWGDTGRGYTQHGTSLEPKKISAGEFWLDLHDVSTDFKDVYYTAA